MTGRFTTAELEAKGAGFETAIGSARRCDLLAVVPQLESFARDVANEIGLDEAEVAAAKERHAQEFGLRSRLSRGARSAHDQEVKPIERELADDVRIHKRSVNDRHAKNTASTRNAPRPTARPLPRSWPGASCTRRARRAGR